MWWSHSLKSVKAIATTKQEEWLQKSQNFCLFPFSIQTSSPPGASPMTGIESVQLGAFASDSALLTGGLPRDFSTADMNFSALYMHRVSFLGLFLLEQKYTVKLPQHPLDYNGHVSLPCIWSSSLGNGWPWPALPHRGTISRSHLVTVKDPLIWPERCTSCWKLLFHLLPIGLNPIYSSVLCVGINAVVQFQEGIKLADFLGCANHCLSLK